MDVKFDRLSDVSADITVTLEEKDYADEVKKKLKEIGKTHAEPGFRPGHVPAGMIQKKYGTAVKYDIINNKVSDSLYEYIRKEQLPVLGQPVPAQNEEFDINSADFKFVFRVGLAPEIDAHVDKEMHIPYYTIEVSDDMINRQDESLRRRFGKQVPGDTVEPDALVKGVLTELNADGTPAEGGVVVESGIVAPKYFNDPEQTKLFEGKHVGDTVVFNPWKTCDGNPTELSSMLNVDKEKAEQYKGDFSMEIKEIIVLRLAELNQEYFDEVFGKDNVHNEEEYRDGLKKMIERQLTSDQNFRFSIDAKDIILNKVGDIDLPDDILKDYLKMQNEKLSDEEVAEEYTKMRPDLVWQLTRDSIANKLGVKLEEDDLKAVARMMAQNQFAQYGMANVPDDMLDRYANDILKDEKARQNIINQALDMRLFAAIKNAVTVDDKTVTVEQFNALFAAPEAEA